MSNAKEETPLSCKIDDGELVIRIGINVLTFASNHRDPFLVDDEITGFPRQAWIVTDVLEFAKDVCRELNREEEDGSSPLTNLLDLAFTNALDQGSLGVEEVPAPEYGDEDDE